MFGTNKYKKIKSSRFNSDNERKRYFAIKNYYQNKNSTTIYSKSNDSSNHKKSH